MNQQYDADVSIVNNNAMHVQTLRSFGLINTQSTEQPLQLGLGWSYAQQWKPASPQSPPLSVSCKNIGTLEHWNIEGNLVVAEDPPRLLCAGL